MSDAAAALYERMVERGSPAQRQRAAFQRRQDLRDVVDGLVAASMPAAPG